jgi:putative addiction module component (TIGR02574 family)
MPISLSELDLTQLTVDQRLELIGLLWDSIPDSAAVLPLLEWQRRELERRLAAAGQFPNPMPSTGAEVVAYWEREGLLGTRPDITDPSGHARALREKAEKRERP